MPEQTLAALEFPGLMRVVQSYAVSEQGRSFLARLRPVADLGLIRARFAEIGELSDLSAREGPLPLSDFPGLKPWLAKAQVRGSLLPPQAFNDLLLVLRLARRLNQFIALGGERAPRLAALAGRLKDLSDLVQAISRCISPHNFILDQASEALGQVRRDLADTRESLTRQIKHTFFAPEFQDALQSPIISQRRGRYVIPIKADHKGAIPGIIHDQSQTRATLFIEPLAIVEHNNALSLLANREKREEEAVLRGLTDLVRHHIEDFEIHLEVLGELDALQAKVGFARDFKAIEPIFDGGGEVDFREARHPLLLLRQKENPSQEVVSVDLRLYPDKRFLIISGANAGGKTVSLKTLGLLAVMVQSGIPIPVAEGSRFSPFAQVFADIGDPQDLSQDLSTFSAHLKRALTMLAQAPERSLILLDELGTATDPTEGGALALALLKAFHGRGAYGAATTHLPLIKGFAQRHEGFENVAVVFDEETRRPTYRLAYGVAGASNALKMARELGLNPEILKDAEGYLDQEELRAYHLLAEVEAAQDRLTHQEMELAQKEKELAAAAAEVEDQKRKLEETRRRLTEEARVQALAAIKKAEGEFKAVLARLKEGQESWGRLRQEFSQLQADLLRELTPAPVPGEREAPEFTVGQKVFLPALGLTGEVLTPPGKDGRLEVRARQVKLKVAPEEITPVDKEADRAKAVCVSYAAPEHLPSLNLIGLRVEEALPLVDRLLDQAVLNGMNRVDIIHGLGTGRLKKAVREYLQHHAQVAEASEGDNPGVTVVDLKE